MSSRESRLIRKFLVLGCVTALLSLTPFAALAGPVESDVGASFESIGPLSFAPSGVLFAADNQAAAIYALDLSAHASGKTAGTKAIEEIDSKIASMLGTDAREIAITDIAVHPKSHNTFVSVSRGQGVGSQAVLLRIDGDGTIDVVALESLGYTKVTLANAPNADPDARRDPRQATVTDMAFVEGRLWIAGLSNEEFASKLRSVPYPFDSVADGTSVEIYHGAHGAWETRAPVYTFVPYDIEDEKHLIAGYLCTPLVKFPVNKLIEGKKMIGTTIAELGNRNRPLDMVVYSKGGKDYLLMSNTSRGVMKISTDGFDSQEPITERVGDTAGVAYETIASMKGVEQLDLLDDGHSIIVARTDSGSLNLKTLPLP